MYKLIKFGFNIFIYDISKSKWYDIVWKNCKVIIFSYTLKVLFILGKTLL